MRMFCLVTALLVAAATPASASPNQLPFEVVKVLAGTQQVLVFDRAQNTHVLLSPGSTIDDFVVVEISGIGLTVEKDQERFNVYPRAAQGLALHLEAPNTLNRPPALYSTSRPDTAPVLIADRISDRISDRITHVATSRIRERTRAGHHLK